MPKATLSFNLPDENQEYQDAINGHKYAHVVWDMYQWFRTKTKYRSQEDSDDMIKAYQEAHDHLKELTNGLPEYA